MRVGFIGLGVMGKPMARRLLRAGHTLSIHSRSRPPIDEVVAAGATEAPTASAAAVGADAVITMLPDTTTVERVITGPTGVLEGAHAGTLVIDMSTISARAARVIGARVAEHGCQFVDAPVSGGEEAAVSGRLSIMVGGDDRAVSSARPLLQALGTHIVHVGPIGAGQVAKTCNQLVVLATIEIVAEALVLARAAGVDPARVREAMLGGFASSRVLDTHGRRMLESDFAPGGRARLHVKDVNAVHELGGGRVPTPAFDAAAATLERLLQSGGGELDHSALVTVIEEMAGITVRTASEGRTQ